MKKKVMILSLLSFSCEDESSEDEETKHKSCVRQDAEKQ